MPLRSYPVRVGTATGLVALVLGLSACSGSTSPPVVESPAPPSGASVPPSGAPPAPASPATTTVSVQDLRGALLGVKDIPPGFAEEKDTGQVPAGVIGSSEPGCQVFVRLVNDQTRPATAAGISFTAQDKHAAFGERLVVGPNPRAVGAAINTFREAATSCGEVTLTIKGIGTVTGSMDQQKLENAGDDNSAVLIQVDGGRFAGYTVLLSEIQLGSVLLGTYSIGLTGQAGGGAIKAALDKGSSHLPG